MADVPKRIVIRKIEAPADGAPAADIAKCRDGCENNECADCSCPVCFDCVDPKVKTCHHAKFGKFCDCDGADARVPAAAVAHTA